MSKYRMEVNGVANILLMLQCQVENYDDGSHGMSNETYKNIEEQTILIERYMLAFSNAVSKGEQPPYWHEVRDNPSKYPRNNGK